ncbi:MAG: hypothetical protein B7Z53_04035 [Rhodospirillales bacterium 12-71-4]|nr:MAG: hypothetical protein B7Z53_04035 [Rhodospirillales bacterium 12-71-4]
MPPSLLGSLLAQAHNNAWANHRLLTACAGLTPAELAAPRCGFFPSLAATLNHILVIDWFYVDALEGGLGAADRVAGQGLDLGGYAQQSP